jgi:NAD(P)-dependent dehydrogenase (short-subunit alcohol dehydrogenase family)
MAVEDIKKQNPAASVQLLQMDHMDLASVVSAAKIVLQNETALHGLVNNAGIMAAPFQMSKNGYEAQWQTNYLAHWVLTAHLLPLLLKTAKISPPGTVRIVNVSSVGHHSAPKEGIAFDDTSLPKADGMARYGQSKLANVLHAKTLNKAYGPGSPAVSQGGGEIWASIVHPGLIDTQLGYRAGSEVPGYMKAAARISRFVGVNWHPDKGSWTSVFCIASPDMRREQCGMYFQRIAEPGWQSKLAKDGNLATALEEWTLKQMRTGGWAPENEGV